MEDAQDIIQRVDVYPAVEKTFSGENLATFDMISSYYSLREQGAKPSEKLLVLGTGKNTEFWKSRGATTFDIDPRWNTDVVADANELVKAVGESTYNTVVAEAITIDQKGEKGVNFERLVQEVAGVLRPGGMFFIHTAVVDEIPVNFSIELPSPTEAMKIMRAAGFQDAMFFRGELWSFLESGRKIGDKIVADSWIAYAEVIYRGQKKEKAHTG